MAWLWKVGAGVVVVIYLLFRFSFTRRLLASGLRRFLAWDQDRMAKNKAKSQTYVEMSKKWLESMGNVIKDVGGPVLEVGAGSGANLEYYPAGCRLITMDLNSFFHPYLSTNLEKHNHVTLEKNLVGNAENMEEVRDNSCACVVSSSLLCSVNQEKVLNEVLRVLKPGGRFFFKEHIVEEEGTFTRCFQFAFARMWAALRHNCNITRETDKTIQNFPFENLQAEIIYRDLPNYAFFAKRTYIGFADKPKFKQE